MAHLCCPRCHLSCPRCHLAMLKSRTSTLLSTLSLSFPHLLPGTCTKPGRPVLLCSSASDSHHAPLLLLSQAALPAAASHGRTAASHRGLDSSRLAVPCTEPGRPQQLGVAEPGQPWPGHGVIRPAASPPRRPVHLNLGLLLPTEQPLHLPGDLTGRSRRFPTSSVERKKKRE